MGTGTTELVVWYGYDKERVRQGMGTTEHSSMTIQIDTHDTNLPPKKSL